jgi:transposase
MNDRWNGDYRTDPDEAMYVIRKIAVRAVVEFGYSVQSVADVLGVAKSALHEWINWYRESGDMGLETRLPPGAKAILTEEMEVWLKNAILSTTPAEHGFDSALWTCEILRCLLKRKFGIDVTVSAIRVHLHAMGLSYQRPRYCPAEQDPSEVERFLSDNFIRIRRLAEKLGADIAFEDESGVGISDHAGMTWGEIGKTPEVVLPQKRGGYNVLSIVTPQGQLQYAIEDHTINSDSFIAFLRQILTGRTRPLILLLDRASFHRSKKVRQYVRAHRTQLRIFFLPRYSPELNPDEQVWNQIKNNNLRKQYLESKVNLKEKLRSALKKLQMNIQKIKSFFCLKIQNTHM